MSVECLQNRPPLVHFMREQGPWMRCGAAVREQDRCGPTPAARRDCRTRDRSPFASQPGWRREGHVHFLPVGLYLTGLEVLRRLLQFFFLQRNLFSCLCNKARILLVPYSSSVFFWTVSPTFWTEDRLCFLVKCWCTLRVF